MLDRSVEQILVHLEEARQRGSDGLVFDGDGTLWRGDISEDVFCAAVAEERLLAEALPALRAVASEHAVDTRGSASEVAGKIFDAYRRGEFPEALVCEVMAWCYAGWSLPALDDFAAKVLSSLTGRLNHELAPVFDWARMHGLRVAVVSASPRPLVEHAARQWGIPECDIAAATAALERERIAPRLQEELPYGVGKRRAAERLLGATAWLGAFGDSDFDLPLLEGAAVGVAVRPKESLLRPRSELSGLFCLS